jgi:glycosyltransferase involved in cell wall biosynthesis
MKLKKLVVELSLQEKVFFKKGVPYSALTQWYCKADLTINATPTGGVDKVVLESFSCGVPALVSNETFAPLFNSKKDILLCRLRNENDLSEKILHFIELSSEQRSNEIKKISETVRVQYNLGELIQTILSHGF